MTDKDTAIQPMFNKQFDKKQSFFCLVVSEMTQATEKDLTGRKLEFSKSKQQMFNNSQVSFIVLLFISSDLCVYTFSFPSLQYGEPVCSGKPTDRQVARIVSQVSPLILGSFLTFQAFIIENNSLEGIEPGQPLNMPMGTEVLPIYDALVSAATLDPFCNNRISLS